MVSEFEAASLKVLVLIFFAPQSILIDLLPIFFVVSYVNLYLIYIGYILIPGAESDPQLPRNEKIKGDAKS